MAAEDTINVTRRSPSRVTPDYVRYRRRCRCAELYAHAAAHGRRMHLALINAIKRFQIERFNDPHVIIVWHCIT